MTTIHTLFTIGYAGISSPDDLLEFVTDQNAALIDTRLSPRSRNPKWRIGYLERHCDSYVHFPEFGNVNYRHPDKLIEIKDLDFAVETLAHLLLRRPVVLLCVCADVSKCHRNVITTEMQRRGVCGPVVDLTPKDILHREPTNV